jgi:hypothetical protein
MVGNDEPVPRGPAIEDSKTKEALARYRRRAWLCLGVSVAAFAVVIGLLGIRHARANALLKTGIHTPGIVLSSEWGREGGQVRLRYFVAGVPHERVVNVDSANRYSYLVGERVDVIYDRSDPSRIRTELDANEGRKATTVLVFAFFIALGLLVGALVAVCRPGRWRRMMAMPWRSFSSTYIPPKRRRAGPGVRLTPMDAPGAAPVELMLGATLPQRGAKLGGQQVVWLVGDPSSRVVLAIPRTRELFSARYPKGFTGRQWLAQQRPATRRAKFAATTYLVLIGVCASAGAVFAAERGSSIVATLLAFKAIVIFGVLARTRSRAGS